MSDSPHVSVSVVVPTRNRARYLPALLTALEDQQYHSIEIIVVDDASEDGTWEWLQHWQRAGTATSILPSPLEGEGPGVRERTATRIALRLDAPAGSYAARNAGWRASGGAIVAFTDDDCIPRPGWLAALVAQLDPDPTAVGVQGITLACGGEITPFTHQIEATQPGEPYRTCNIAYRRAALEEIGGFDDTLRWYADNIFGLEARSRGPIAFAPGAIVEHPPRPREWRDRAAWRARFAADARHRAELYRHNREVPLPRRALPVLLWIVRPLLKQGGGHLRYLLHHPVLYVRQIGPMAREKVELLLALREEWREAPTPQAVHAPVDPPPPLPAGEGVRFPHPHLPPLPSEPLVSVVVVTRGDRGTLYDTLTALPQQTWRQRETIVVAHGSEGTPDGIGSTACRYLQVRPDRTLAEARQAGVDAARGDIVAFTDDDCLPDPEWLECLVRAFRQTPAFWGVQGRTEAEPGPIGTHAIRITRPDRLYQTCNIAYRRAALERVGGFDRRFDAYFEDTALGARVSQRGPIGFQSTARVVHRALPRRTLDRATWRRVLDDEARLALYYPRFYRRVRGPGLLVSVVLHWLIGSPLKALWRELPRVLTETAAYGAFARRLARERLALVAALVDRTKTRGGRQLAPSLMHPTCLRSGHVAAGQERHDCYHNRDHEDDPDDRRGEMEHPTQTEQPGNDQDDYQNPQEIGHDLPPMFFD